MAWDCKKNLFEALLPSLLAAMLATLLLLGCGKESTTKPGENIAPVACFTINPESGSVTTLFQLDASCSQDEEDDADLLRVRWDWESDGVWDTDWSTAKVATHRFSTTGEKTITLEVKDTGGLTDTTSQKVTVAVAKPEMILVPAGTFQMGDGQQCRTIHQVTLTHNFYLGKYEVTTQQYRDALQWAYDQGLVTVSGTSVLDNVGPSQELLLCIKPYAAWAHIGFDNGTFLVEQGYADHPMIAVSWYGAAAYCNWLSMIEGLPPAYDHESWLCVGGNPYDAQGYRLPTDAEWEYAACYNDGRLYPWGDEPPDCNRCNFNYCRNGAVAVGSFELDKTYLGFYDMAGNVEEFCNDFWQCHLGSDPVVDPCGPATGDMRMIHGGSWTTVTQDYVRRTRRCDINHTVALSYLGFRIARSE